MQKLKIRNLTTDDLESIRGIHSSNCDFPFPDLLNNLYCCSKVVEDPSGNILGVGMVRLTSESILILDKTNPRSIRARTIKMLVDKMKSEVQSLGMDETSCFISDEDSELRRMLKKAFGFLECKARAIYLQF